MRTMEPIREVKKIETMKLVLGGKNGTNTRDVLLFTMGINTALRVSDILGLTVGDVMDEKGRPRHSVELREKKTGKLKKFPLNSAVAKALKTHLEGRKGTMTPSDPLFCSRKGGLQLSRVEAWRVLRAAGQKIGLENIGSHTMRKTFGYHMYKRSGRDIALVQELLNHGSPRQTLRYIGISQEEKDGAYLDLNL